VVTGLWDVESTDPSGHTVQWFDPPYGWTCVVGDPQNVSITYDESPTTPADTAPTGGAPATPSPTGRNFITGEGLPAEAVPDTCLIKGNVSVDTGERIYHVPGQAFYDETVVNEAYGERWFCTEDEALAAGWRKSRQ